MNEENICVFCEKGKVFGICNHCGMKTRPRTEPNWRAVAIVLADALRGYGRTPGAIAALNAFDANWEREAKG